MANSAKVRKRKRPPVPTPTNSIAGWIVRLAALPIDAFAVWLVYMMLGDGVWQLRSRFSPFVTIGINVIFLRPQLYLAVGVARVGNADGHLHYPIPSSSRFISPLPTVNDGHLLIKAADDRAI